MTQDLRLALGTHVAVAHDGETVLDALLRVGAPLAFSCKSGVCHACALRCLGGEVPEAAQRGLPAHLAERDYFLPCQCMPQTSMVLGPRRDEDQLQQCLLVSAGGHGSGVLTLELEPVRAFEYSAGDRLLLIDADAAREWPLELTSDPRADYFITARLALPAGAPEPAVLAADGFGVELKLRGPLRERPSARPSACPVGPEIAWPTPDPALWKLLGDGATVRRVLDAFYLKVYADATLAPFFEGVTLTRSIEKQYSFLKACITGEKCYFGNRPRNAHHWMIIDNALFDYRQALMIATLREHGLDADLIARWTSFEEHFRADIVKAAAWPRQVGDTLIDTETFERETLLEATLCDHCGDEIAAGTSVLYHRRLGRIGCERCQGSAVATAAA